MLKNKTPKKIQLLYDTYIYIYIFIFRLLYRKDIVLVDQFTKVE